MNQFLITQNVKSISKYLNSYEKYKDEVAEICSKYGHKILKVFVLNEDEKKVGVIVQGDIKTVGAGFTNPRILQIMKDAGVVLDSIRTDVYGAHAIRLKILSEMESSISKVLYNESNDNEEVILIGNETGKLQPEICYK